MVSVLFVCLGNICRSPAAEGMLKHLGQKNPHIKNLHVKSCGTGNWHVGSLPDGRMCEAAKARGITLASRAQQFRKEFFDQFDYIFAVDQEVLKSLYDFAATPEHKAKIYLFTEYSSAYKGEDIPDPYYSGFGAFDLVLDMLEDSCEGLLTHLNLSQ